MRARQEYLWAALLTPDVVDIGADAIAVFEVLARDKLVAADDGLATTEIDDDVAVFDTLHGAVDDLADAVLVFVELAVTLGLAHFLNNDLFRGLGCNAAEIHRRQLLGNEVADFGVGVALACRGQRDLAAVILDGVDHFHQPLQLHLAGVRVDVGADVGLLAVTRARRLLDGVRHRGDHDRLVDRLLARDRIGDLQQFEPVGTDYHFRLPELPPWRGVNRSCVSTLSSETASSGSPRRFLASLRALLSLDNASRIRSSVRTSRASAIAS